MLFANRHTCVLGASGSECHGVETDDHWSNYTDATGIKRTPEEDSEGQLHYRWIGFSVFQISAPDDIERLQPATRDVNARAPNASIRLKFPSEQTASGW